MKTKQQVVRTGTKAGAAIGIVTFLIFGLIPGFYFGSYGSLVVLKHLIGTVEPSVFVRMFTAVGILLGVLSTAFVHIVVGSIIGTVGGYMAAALRTPAEVKETAGASVNAS